MISTQRDRREYVNRCFTVCTIGKKPVVECSLKYHQNSRRFYDLLVSKGVWVDNPKLMDKWF